MVRSNVVSPDHPRWNEFIQEPSKAPICARTTENARRVLASMEGIGSR